VQTNHGVTGWGEITGTVPTVAMELASALFPLLDGENPTRIEYLWQKLFRSHRNLRGGAFMVHTIAAIDMALWDIRGKHFGEPIHRLLGGKYHDRIQAYASILFGKDGDETARIGERWREAGYRAVKFGWEPMGQRESLDLDLVRGAREGVGDDGTVLIDAGGFDRAGALAAVDDGRADAVAFGRFFISNPDLPRRLQIDAPLTPYYRPTFYGGGELGYTDYPKLEAQSA